MSDEEERRARLIRALEISERLRQVSQRVAERLVHEHGLDVTAENVLSACVRAHRRLKEISSLATELRLTLNGVAEFANTIDPTDPSYDFASGLLQLICPVLDKIPRQLNDYVPPPPRPVSVPPVGEDGKEVDQMLQELSEPRSSGLRDPPEDRRTVTSSFPGVPPSSRETG